MTTGGTSITRTVALAEYPVYARAGTILPTQPDVPTSSDGPQDELTLHVWSGSDGSFDLYEDAGTGFGYEDGSYRFTPMRFTEETGCREVRIGAAEGADFVGALDSRSWHVRLVGVDSPTSVGLGDEVLASGGTTPGYVYDADARVLTIHTGVTSTDAELRVWVGAACE